MQFIDLKAQYAEIEDDVDARIKGVLAHGQYVLGPEVKELEEQLAAFVGARHCIGVASGTDALMVALMALGIGPGDEVVTTPFSFISTAEVIALLGARPVFVDIDPVSYNIDAAKIENAITPRTRAIMPVSLYGQCADFDSINAVAEKHSLPVIEDAAQSFGATYQGRTSCALSTIGCTSFFPSKPLGCYGDGGACFTDDDQLARAMREIHVHGQDGRYHHPRLGINGRLDTIQAAVLLAKLPRFAGEVKARGEAGQRYTEAINAHAGNGVLPPTVLPGNTSVYAQYTVQVDDRERVQASMREAGVPTAVHYPTPLPAQPAIADLSGGDMACPVAEAASRRVMSLPMHPFLTAEQQSTVLDALFAAVA